MWLCSQCKEQNEDQFLTCWKCQNRKPNQAASSEVPGPEDSHLDLMVDPERPVPIGDGGHVACPTCGTSFKVQHEKVTKVRHQRLESALCPYCSNPVTPEVLVRVAGQAREKGAVREVLFACPYCGKIVGVSETK